MSALTKLAIANRALQHVGQKKLTALTDNSKAATEFATCYDILRRAELRRNVWTFSIRRVILRAVDTDTRVVAPSAWANSPVSYDAGALVTYNGIIYLSAIDANAGSNPETSDNWQVYFGPRTAAQWTNDFTYFVGEMVLTPDNQVYISLVNDNDFELVPDEWDAATTYSIGDTVWFGSAVYQSYSNSNLNNSPDAGPASWDSETAYVITNQVTYLGNIYQASGSSTGDVPTDGAPWTLIGAAKWDFDPDWPGDDWLFLSASVLTPFIPYPAGTGPASQNSTRNIYYLPAGFLREAPQSPKAGNASPLGAPTNITVNDWLIENGFIISSDPGPIAYRFAADIQNPGQFDPLFVEGLGCRVGMEVCETLTQSNGKIATVAQKYKQFMGDARTVNAIEKGPEEAPLDDYLAARI